MNFINIISELKKLYNPQITPKILFTQAEFVDFYNIYSHLDYEGEYFIEIDGYKTLSINIRRPQFIKY